MVSWGGLTPPKGALPAIAGSGGLTPPAPNFSLLLRVGGVTPPTLNLSAAAVLGGLTPHDLFFATKKTMQKCTSKKQYLTLGPKFDLDLP